MILVFVLKSNIAKEIIQVGNGGLKSYHLGGRGRRISSSRLACVIKQDPVSKKKERKTEGKERK
jgi:hypothetical protein